MDQKKTFQHLRSKISWTFSLIHRRRALSMKPKVGIFSHSQQPTRFPIRWCSMRNSVPCVLLLFVSCVPLLAYDISQIPRPMPLNTSFTLVDHPFYEFLDRFETMGGVPLISYTRPMLGRINHPLSRWNVRDRDVEFRRYYNEALANMWVLGRGDSAFYSPWWKVRQFFGIGSGSARWLYGTGYHFCAGGMSDSRGFFGAAQPVYGLEMIRTNDQRGTITRFTSGLRVEGGYAQHWQFMVDFRDHTEAGNGPYWSRSQLYEDRWASVDESGGRTTSYDISESFLQYYGKDLAVAAGRGRFRWGPAHFGSLFLNSNMPPIDYVRFDAVFESHDQTQALGYTFLHGSLASHLAEDTLYQTPSGRWRTLDTQKYLSAQRLEFRARPNLLFGFSQGVIYGDRGIQLGYITPLNFLYSVQHSNNDKDNLVLAGDVTWRPVHGLKLWGEGFLDDLTVSKLTTNFGGNKSAFTMGFQGIIPREFWSKFDLTAEYTKIRPFVYTHVFRVNTYTDWTSPLGYTLRPNSETMTVELRATLYPVQCTAHWSHTNHGSLGGDIATPLPDQNQNQLYSFLGGRSDHLTQSGMRISWEALPNLFLRAQGMLISATDHPNRFEAQAGVGWNL
jgi:hypothetical protein